MAININQLTSELRMMPDQALQRMAMMYKQDPYIFPMIISEDMARKKMRAASQVQMAQPQPKVVDQALMAMAPQEAGIAQLPAPNMQNMADGGIAGQADDMEFVERSEPVVRMAGGGVPGYQAGGQPTGITAKGQAVGVTPYGGIYGGERLLPTTTGYEGMSIEEFLRTAYNDVSEAVKRLYDKIPKESLAQVVAEDLAKQKSQEAAQRPAAGGARSAGIGGPRAGEREAYEAMMAGAPQPGASGAAPGAGAGAPSRAPSAGTGAAAPADGGIYSLAGRLFDPIEERTRAQLGRMRMTAQQRSEEEQAAFEAGKPKGKAYEGLEGLLKKEAEGEAGEREQAKAMAIFNAGLAMMAGGSPRALENIAKGAMVGSGQYAEAIKDFKKAAKERQKMLANIEEARRAEARDDSKTAMSLLQRANDNESRMEMFALDATTSLGLKKADLTGRLFGTQMEQEGAMARVRAQDPLALYRALDPTGKGNIAKGFEAAQTAKREPVTESSLRQEWAKNMALQMNFPDVNDFIRMMMPKGQTAGTSVDSSGFKVLGVRNP